VKEEEGGGELRHPCHYHFPGGKERDYSTFSYRRRRKPEEGAVIRLFISLGEEGNPVAPF